MVKTDFPNVVAVKNKVGRTYYYFRVRVSGAKPLLLPMPPDPRSPLFAEKWHEYAKPDEPTGPTPFSFRALVTSYRSTGEFAQLAPLTKRDYLKRLDWIAERLGDYDATKFPRSEVIRIRDACIDRPREANYRLSVMSILMEHAIDLDWRSDNPAKGVKKLKLGEGYKPWTPDQIDCFREHADPIPLLAFELALGTGQRPSDLVRMRWSDYDGEAISVIQSKTGTKLWLPPTDELKAHLEAAKARARGLTILTGERGQPLTYAALESRVRRVRQKAKIEGVSLHGLRKNATIELAQAGCSTEQIKAITGHTSDAMVTLYAKGSSQRLLARQARERSRA